MCTYTCIHMTSDRAYLHIQYNYMNATEHVNSIFSLHAILKHNYLILANNKNPGFIEFPEYEISFFDPKKEEYITNKQKSKKIKVTGFRDDTKALLELETENLKSVTKNTNFIILYLISFLAITTFITTFLYYFLKRGKQKNKKQSKTARDAKNQIIKAYKLAKKNNPDLFKNLLLQSLSLYFSKKFNINQSNFTKEKLEKELNKNKTPIHIVTKTLDIINKLEMFNYSGRNDLKISEEIFKDSIDIIDEIEQLNK